MKIELIIEKGNGEWWGRIEDKGNFLPVTVGDTVTDVISNMRGLLQDYQQHEGQEDQFWQEVDLDKVEFVLKIERFVNKTVTFSADATKSEIESILSNLLQQEIQLTEESFQQIKIQEKEKEAVKEIIEPFYTELNSNSNSNRGKIEELKDVGKFIFKFNCQKNLKLALIGCQEHPDFIITVDGEPIGLEHTRLTNEKSRIIGDLKKAIKRAKEILVSAETMPNLLINIYFTSELLPFYPANYDQLPKKVKGEISSYRNQLPQLIANYIQGVLRNVSVERPAFIQNIEPVSSDGFDLRINFDYTVNFLTSAQIIGAISKKEERLGDYKQMTSCKKFWLLIVIEGVGEHATFKVSSDTPQIGSDYDRIILFENFSGKVWIVK